GQAAGVAGADGGLGALRPRVGRVVAVGGPAAPGRRVLLVTGNAGVGVARGGDHAGGGGGGGRAGVGEPAVGGDGLDGDGGKAERGKTDGGEAHVHSLPWPGLGATAGRIPRGVTRPGRGPSPSRHARPCRDAGRPARDRGRRRPRGSASWTAPPPRRGCRR